MSGRAAIRALQNIIVGTSPAPDAKPIPYAQLRQGASHISVIDRLPADSLPWCWLVCVSPMEPKTPAESQVFWLVSGAIRPRTYFA